MPIGYQRRKKIPLAIHLADYSEEFEELKNQKILYQAKKLICITEEMKSRFEKMLGRKDIEVLHNGAELESMETSFKKFSHSAKKTHLL